MDRAIEHLQSEMADVDFWTRRSQQGVIEFLVIKKQNLKIKMYQEQGHAEPHIHIDYGDQNHAASYSISDGRRLCGNLDRKYEKQIKSWIGTHQQALKGLWEEAQAGRPVDELIIGIKNA